MNISYTCTKQYVKKLLIESMISVGLGCVDGDVIIVPKCIKVEQIKRGFIGRKTYYKWTWDKVGFFEIEKNEDDNKVVINIWYENDIYMSALYSALQNLDVNGYVKVESSLIKHVFKYDTYSLNNLPKEY